MICHVCHTPLPNDATYCPECGAVSTPAVTGPTQRLIPPTPISSAPDTDYTPSPSGGDAGDITTIRQGICPHCQAVTIYTDAHRSIAEGDAVQLSITPTRQAQITHFVCRSCGYLESYILDDEDRAAIEAHWAPIDSSILATAQLEHNVLQLRSEGLMIAAVNYVRVMTGMDIDAAIAFVEAL